MNAKITRCIILIIVGVMAITNLGGCSKKCEHTDLTELSDYATCTSKSLRKKVNGRGILIRMVSVLNAINRGRSPLTKR